MKKESERAGDGEIGRGGEREIELKRNE